MTGDGFMATDLGKTLVLYSWNQSMGWAGKDLKSHLDPWAGVSPRLFRAPELLDLNLSEISVSPT